MTELRWMLADLKTGDVQGELPLILDGQLDRRVSRQSTALADLPIHDRRCPGNWHQLLTAGRSMVVPVMEDLGSTPLHGYIVTLPTAGGPVVPITLTSVEVVAAAANVYDHDFYGVDQSRIIETLLSDHLADEFGLTLEVTDCGRTADRTYSWADDDMTVADALDELTGRVGGPEWAMRVRWADSSQRRFEKVVEVGPRIGRRIESTVFENFHLAERQRPRDMTPGRAFATAVQAVGAGSGAARQMSRTFVDQESIDAGTPQWYTRVTDTLAESEADLDDYAVSRLTRMRYGSQAWDLTLNLAEPGCPMPVRDFDAGDTVTMALDPTPDDPASWHGPARVIGWRMKATGNTLTQFTPVFWDPTELEDA